jgi:hypothetical protein
MSGDCGVCIGGSIDEVCEFIHIQDRKARKPHKCCECGKEIVKGEKYEHARGKCEGEMWSSETCLVCREIAEAFYCDGRMFGGELWEEMEYAYEAMTTGCLDRLTTVAAKTELMRRWNEWKFGRASYA